jgi:hypothetical protein
MVNLALIRIEAKITGGLATETQSPVSVNSVPDISCNDNVNASYVVFPNGCTYVSELNLPKFNNSAKQIVAHFLKELDDYFALKKTQKYLKLPLSLGPSTTLLPKSSSRQFTTCRDIRKL